MCRQIFCPYNKGITSCSEHNVKVLLFSQHLLYQFLHEQMELTDEFEGSSLLHVVDADTDSGILSMNERELVTDWFPRKRHYRLCKCQTIIYSMNCSDISNISKFYFSLNFQLE